MSLTILVKKHRSNGSKMSFHERENVSEQLASYEEMKNSENQHLIQNKSSVSLNMEKLKNLLGKDDKLVAKGKEKDRLKKENGYISKELKKHIPPMHIQKTSSKDSNAFEKAVQASMHATDPAVVNLANHYKNNSRRLEPSDPNAGSIDALVGE